MSRSGPCWSSLPSGTDVVFTERSSMNLSGIDAPLTWTGGLCSRPLRPSSVCSRTRQIEWQIVQPYNAFLQVMTLRRNLLTGRSQLFRKSSIGSFNVLEKYFKSRTFSTNFWGMEPWVLATKALHTNICYFLKMLCIFLHGCRQEIYMAIQTWMRRNITQMDDSEQERDSYFIIYYMCDSRLPMACFQNHYIMKE